MNERELADAERMLNDARVRTKPKLPMGHALLAIGGFVASIVLMTAIFGAQGGALATLFGSMFVVSARKSIAPAHDLRLQPEGISDVTRPDKVTLLSYADIDEVTCVNDVVVIRAGARTLTLQSAEPSTLHRYLDAHVRAAHALADERRTASDFLVRVDTAPDYRHAAAPASALEAIARAKGMPLQLRVDAARAIDLPEDEIGVTEELKESKAMFDD